METRQTPRKTEGAASTAALIPPVNVVEDEAGITLTADLPGVSRDDLSIRVENDTLTIEGAVKLGEIGQLDPVYAEVRVGQYRRSFALSRELDTERIEASMKNGVLKLKVPKSEQAKPRRVDVKID